MTWRVVRKLLSHSGFKVYWIRSYSCESTVFSLLEWNELGICSCAEDHIKIYFKKGIRKYIFSTNTVNSVFYTSAWSSCFSLAKFWPRPISLHSPLHLTSSSCIDFLQSSPVVLIFLPIISTMSREPVFPTFNQRGKLDWEGIGKNV